MFLSIMVLFSYTLIKTDLTLHNLIIRYFFEGYIVIRLSREDGHDEENV